MTSQHPNIKCVQRAVEFMAAEIGDDNNPSLDAIAEASGFSKFHFHRLYHVVTGETCQDTITRLRLARGAGALQDKQSVTQAAMAAGYASSQAFAKAMKREVTETASALKNDPERLGHVIAELSQPKPSETGRALRVELCSLEPFEIASVRTKDAYPGVNATYWGLVEALGGGENVEAFLGYPQSDVSLSQAGDFIFECAVSAVDNMPDLDGKAEPKTQEGGHFLTIRHTGPDAKLPETLDELYHCALTQDGLRLSDTPYFFHYIDDPEEVDEADCRSDIYLKVELGTDGGVS